MKASASARVNFPPAWRWLKPMGPRASRKSLWPAACRRANSSLIICMGAGGPEGWPNAMGNCFHLFFCNAIDYTVTLHRCCHTSSASNNCTAGQIICRLLQRTLVKKFAVACHHIFVSRYFLNGELCIEPCGNAFGIGVLLRAHNECHIA